MIIDEMTWLLNLKLSERSRVQHAAKRVRGSLSVVGAGMKSGHLVMVRIHINFNDLRSISSISHHLKIIDK
jgi:hypothetical protein